MGFKLPDLVAVFRGSLIIFRFDGLAKLFLQFLNAGFNLEPTRQAGRNFANMPGPLVNGLDNRFQSFGKGIIAGGTAQTAGLFEIRLTKAAHRAALAGGSFFQFLCRAQPQQKISQFKACGIGDPLLLGAGFAQVYLLHFPVQNLSEENGCRIGFANVADHVLGSLVGCFLGVRNAETLAVRAGFSSKT